MTTGIRDSIEQYIQPIRSAVRYYSRGLQEADQEDLVQESILRLYRNQTKPKYTKYPYSYIKKVALKSIRERKRVANLQRTPILKRFQKESFSDQDGPDEIAKSRETVFTILNELDRMEDDMNTVIVLDRALHERTLKEIGKILGISQQAVHARYERTIERLRKKLTFVL